MPRWYRAFWYAAIARVYAPTARDAAQQGQLGGLLELVLRALAQVPEKLGVVACIGQLLRHMEGRQRPAQFGCECPVPVLTSQLADFAFGPKAGEHSLGRP